MKKLFILIIFFVVLILIIFSLKANTITVEVSWDYYPDYGSSDVKYLVLFWDKFNIDTTFIESGNINNIGIEDTVKMITVEKGYIYKFWMTAVDSTDLMSSNSNEVYLSLIKPNPVRNVRIKVR